MDNNLLKANRFFFKLATSRYVKYTDKETGFFNPHAYTIGMV